MQKAGGWPMQLRRKLASPPCSPSSTTHWVEVRRLLLSRDASMGPLRRGLRHRPGFMSPQPVQITSTAQLVSAPCALWVASGQLLGLLESSCVAKCYHTRPYLSFVANWRQSAVRSWASPSCPRGSRLHCNAHSLSIIGTAAQPV